MSDVAEKSARARRLRYIALVAIAVPAAVLAGCAHQEPPPPPPQPVAEAPPPPPAPPPMPETTTTTRVRGERG